MSDYFQQNNEILSLATEFRKIAGAGNVLSEKVKHPYRKKYDLRKFKLNEFLKSYNYLGMTMAIRKNLLTEILSKIENSEKQRKQTYLTYDTALNFYEVLLQ